MKRILILLILLICISAAASRDFPRPWEVVFYTNSTVAYCNVTIDGQPAAEPDEVGAFINGECRGLGVVVESGGQTICSMNIQGSVPEMVEFAVWDASEDLVCSVSFTTQTNPGGDIGYPPNLLPIAAVTDPNQNLAPVWSLPQNLSFDEDTVYYLELTNFVTDPEGDNLLFNCAQSGDLTVNISQATAALFPPENYFGENSLIFTADDGENVSADTLFVSVLPVNDPPFLFVSDDFTFNEDDSLLVNLNQYVQDVDGDELIFEIYNNIHINYEISDSLLQLSAQTNWHGSENLLLAVSDGFVQDTDNFLVTVIPVNDAPVIDLPDVISFPEDGQSSLNLQIYAYDPDNDILNFSITESGEGLIAEINQDTLFISAEADWFGSAFIYVLAEDASGLTAEDSLEVIVTPVNDAPEISLPAVFEFAEDSLLVEDFSIYIEDVDSDDLLLQVSGNVQTQTSICGLMVTFSASENWFGSEEIIFTVSDGENRLSASAETTLNILPVNDPPVLQTPASLSFLEYNSLTEDFSIYASDPENDLLSLSNSGNDSILVEIDSLLVTFSALPGFTGTELITFTLSDNEFSVSVEIEVEVLPMTELPAIILPEAINILEDEVEVRDFSAYIFNEEGFNLTLTASGHQDISVFIEDYSVAFSAPENWFGQENIEFTIADNDAGFSTSDQVLVNFLSVNDPPQLDLPDSIVFEEDNSFYFDCSSFIYDPDNSVFTLSCLGNQNIFVSIEGLVLNLQPEMNFFGQEVLQITVNDNSGRAIDTDSLVVNVIPVNDPPQSALPEELVFAEDTYYTLDIDNFIMDVDNDSLVIDWESSFQCDFIWQNDDIVQFVPPPNYFGSGIITASISDSEFTVTDSIIVTVTPVNDPPVINLPDSFDFPEDTVYSFDITDYAFDVDNEDLYITYSGSFFIFVEISGSVVQLEPLNNWNGNAEFTFTVSDGSLSASDDVTLQVTPVNDPPVLNSFFPLDTELLFYGETLQQFSVDVYDADSDLNYQWYVNEEMQTEVSEEFSYTFTAAGTYEVLVQISDEEYSLQQEWNVELFNGPGWQFIVYTNSTVCYGLVTLDGEQVADNDLVGAFVGQECRGIGEINNTGSSSYTSFLIQGETIETVTFKFYSAAADTIYDIPYTTQTSPGGDIGYPPNLLPLAAYTIPGPGWIPSDSYTDSTNVYLAVTIDGELAAESDIIGAFATADDECLGVGSIQHDGEIACSYFPVYQDEAVPFYCQLWDADLNLIYYDFTSLLTNPGNDIGAPGEEILLDFSTTPGPDWSPVVYTNSTTAYCQIRLDGQNAEENDLLGVFVENECRAVGNIFLYENQTYSTVEIQGVEIDTCSFKLWDASAMDIIESEFTVETNPGGTIGYPPAELPVDFWSYELPEIQAFPRPWQVVYYTNSTVAYGYVTVDGEPAPEDHEIAAFIDNECRGLAYIVSGEQSIFTMNIQGDSPAPVQFNYYDAADDEVYSIDFVAITNPGGDIGYPPDLLPLHVITNYPPLVNLPPGFTFNEDEVVEQDLAEFISDPDGDELILGFSGNENITIEIEGLYVTCWGDENWFGTETIQYTVDDGHGHIITDSLYLEVLSVNDPPIVELPYSFTIQEDDELQVDFALFITDVEGDPWTLSVTGNENIDVNITGSLVSLAPQGNWNGEEFLTFTADDGQDAGSDELLVIVNPQPDAPIVDMPEQFSLLENSSLTINYNDYITDPEGDEFTVSASGNQNIQVLVEGDSLTFLPEEDWFGAEIITIYADDGTRRLVGSDDVEVIVEYVHQPPLLDLPADLFANEDEPQSFDLTPYFTIFEGDEFVFTASGNDSINIAFDEADMSISAPLNWYGVESVIITLDDEPGRVTVSDTVNIHIEAVNDPPELISWLPDNLEFDIVIDSVVTFSVEVVDLDSDVDYSWYVNDELYADFDSTLSFEFTQEGEFEIMSVTSDTEFEVSVVWQVNAVQVQNNSSDIVSSTLFHGNYPNPFNPVTNFSFSLAADSYVEISVYNLKGSLIRKLGCRNYPPGNHQVSWMGNNEFNAFVSSGIYFYTFQVNGKMHSSGKCLILK